MFYLGPGEDDMDARLLSQAIGRKEMKHERLSMNEERIFLECARAAQELERFEATKEETNRRLYLDDQLF